MELFDLTGKKAIVTGGSRGLGRGAAEGLLEAGAEVVLIGSSEAVHTTAHEYCGKGFKAHGLQADLGDEAQLLKAFDNAMELLDGRLDILCRRQAYSAAIRRKSFRWRTGVCFGCESDCSI